MGFWKDLLNPFHILDGDVPEPWERQRAPYPTRKEPQVSTADLTQAMTAMGHKFAIVALNELLDTLPEKGMIDVAVVRTAAMLILKHHVEGKEKTKFPNF